MTSNDFDKAAVGFVGIGNMGWPMAACIAAAGNKVTVFDLDTGRVKSFAKEKGAGIAATDIAPVSQENDMFPQTEIGRHLLQSRPERTIADEHELQLRMLRHQVRRRSRDRE